MGSIHRSVAGQPSDLLDQVAAKLEHIRSVAWSVADQVDRLGASEDIRDIVSGEVGLIYAQLIEAQQLVDQLSVDSPAPSL